MDEILKYDKAIEQYFPVVLSVTLYKGILTFESVDESVTIQMKAVWQYLPVVRQYKVVPTLVDEIRKLYHRKESH